MTLDLSLTQLEVAWADHLRTDSDFLTAIGLGAAGAARLVRGWPTAMLTKPAKNSLPLVSWYPELEETVGDDRPETITIVTDLWDWHDMEKFAAVDEAMVQRMSGEHGCVSWYDAPRTFGISSSLIDRSDPPDVVPRRRRRWLVAPA